MILLKCVRSRHFSAKNYLMELMLFREKPKSLQYLLKVFIIQPLVSLTSSSTPSLLLTQPRSHFRRCYSWNMTVLVTLLHRTFSLVMLSAWNTLPPRSHISHPLSFGSWFTCHLGETTPDHLLLKASSHSLTLLC